VRNVGSLNSLQHMRGTRDSSALGRINSYLSGDARRRGRGMMTRKNREGGDTLEDYVHDEGERDPFGHGETLNTR